MLTKQEFEEAYRKFPPCKCELFFLRYVSMHSLQENKLFALIISIGVLFPILLEIIFHYFNFSWCSKMIPPMLYSVMLIIFGTYWLTIWNIKRKRVEKIRKSLNITKEEYKDLITIYYYHRYPSMKDFVDYNSKIKCK